jgi:hypothetical protein
MVDAYDILVCKFSHVFPPVLFAVLQNVGAAFKIATSAQRKTAPTKVSAVGHGMLI